MVTESAMRAVANALKATMAANANIHTAQQAMNAFPVHAPTHRTMAPIQPMLTAKVVVGVGPASMRYSQEAAHVAMRATSLWHLLYAALHLILSSVLRLKCATPAANRPMRHVVRHPLSQALQTVEPRAMHASAATATL